MLAECGPTEPTIAWELNRASVERANTGILATIAHTPHGPQRQRIGERAREQKRWQNEFKEFCE